MTHVYVIINKKNNKIFELKLNKQCSKRKAMKKSGLEEKRFKLLDFINILLKLNCENFSKAVICILLIAT